MDQLSLLDLQELAEGCDLEVKRAAGRDGRGELPQSFWETYSAMANSQGGIVLLGIEEKPKGSFSITGIEDTGRVLRALWDGLNNPQIVSTNLLSDSQVETLELGGRNVLRIRIPRATRTQRPVHLGLNPLTGTFRRNFEGDYRCDEETVRRMLAERVEDVRDARVLKDYTFDDLEMASFEAYRTLFRATKPDHPWVALDNKEFLRSIGGWGRDRETGDEGLTLAGLLMFGKLRSILDEVPHYVVDYQERTEPRAVARWIDRFTTDGTWSGNLFDFYRLVIQKLTHGLKVPFQLRGTQRIDETPVHEALREALVNTLIHADYTGRVSILVVKRPDMFGFRNPGTLRLPLEDALRGGTSDCRNRNLQKMFQLVGLGEQAGSGIPKILESWRKEHWRAPELVEKPDPEQTQLWMLMVSLLPEEVLRELDRRFGSQFRQLAEVQHLALATVAIEGQVSHARLRAMTTEHPSDLTKALGALVKAGYLESEGATRGTIYFFPGQPPSGLLDLGDESSVHKDASSVHSEPSSVHTSDGATAAEKVRTKRRAPRTLVQHAILELCRDKWLGLSELADGLRRSAESIRIHYLRPMAAAGQIELRYPERLNHPAQAYRAKA